MVHKIGNTYDITSYTKQKDFALINHIIVFFRYKASSTQVLYLFDASRKKADLWAFWDLE